MKVALIGDVHANLPALEAVLAHAHEQGIEAIWHVGDFVGYGAFPNQVIQRLRNEDAISIVGNYDLKVLQFKKKRDKWRSKKPREKYLAFKWAYESLSKKNRKYLRFLSQEIRMKVKGKRILLTHGSPASDEEHLTPDTPDKRLRKLAQMAEADVIICGHSHQPFARQVDGVWFINTGSVGRPDDGDPRACYAILEIEADNFQVHHYRVEYDVERAVTAIREQELPEVFAQMLLQGRNLDVVQEEEEEEEQATASRR
jgi:putative phosphoesterase